MWYQCWVAELRIVGYLLDFNIYILLSHAGTPTKIFPGGEDNMASPVKQTPPYFETPTQGIFRRDPRKKTP